MSIPTQTKLVFLTLWLLSCSSAPVEDNDLTRTSEEGRQTLEEVRQTLLEYQLAVREGGLLAEFGYLDSSDDFFWVPPGHTCAITFDSVAHILRVSAPVYTKIENSFDTLTIKPLSASMAMYTGRLTSVSRDTSGKTIASKLIETGLVVKRSGKWKLLSGQTTVLPD